MALKFSRTDLSQLKKATLYVTDMRFSVGYPPLEEDAIREVFQQFVSPAIADAQIFGKPLNKTTALVLFTSLKWIVEMGCVSEGLCGVV